MSILDHFLPPAQAKKKRRDPNMIEKHFMPKAKKKGDLFSALKPTGKKQQRLSDDQVAACKKIFGESYPACDPQNVFGKMFEGKK